MNYFLRTESESDFSLKLNKKNEIDLSSFLALGTFINAEESPDKVHYVHTTNSKTTVENIESSDFILNVSGGFLISEKTKQIIDSNFQSECQFIKALIDYKGAIIDGFYSLNVFNKVKCYDLNLSEYEYLESFDSYEFDKIVLDESPLEEYGLEYNIVRSREDNKIVVSEKFKELMISENINSIAFEKEFDMGF